MEKLKKQLEDIKDALHLMIKLGAIDQSAYKTLNEALDEALQQYAVMQRSEQVCDFVSWAKDNVKRPAYENIEFWLAEWRYQKSQTCA